eukprot:scaffold5410_cov112-Skeletonema_menzelii.AAC.10
MGQRLSDAAVMDAQIKLRQEECALGTVQRSLSSDGCTNYAQKGGVCIRHGTKRKLSMIVYSTKRIGC